MSAGAATPATAALWLAPVLAYLFGSISFSYLIVRALKGIDIRTVGSGNAGATNVLRLCGLQPAIAVLLLDVAKGVLAVWAARWLGAWGPVEGAAAVAAVVGHIFPIYFGFRGGKGVATATGAMSSLTPLAALLGLCVFAIVVAVTRYVSLGSMFAVGVYPFLVWLCGATGWSPAPPGWLLASAVVLALLIVGKHYDNVISLRQGLEWRLGDPRDGGGEPRQRKPARD